MEGARTPQMREIRNNSVREDRRRRLTAGAVALGLAYLGALAVNRSLVAVRGPSMLPALWPGDRVVTVPALGRLHPGDVVVVRDPTDPGHAVVKRVHAVDGTGIDVRGDHAAASTDSRVWGPVSRDAVRRKVLRRWPDLRTPIGR